ncbi:MAG TPA: hypothetical protein VE596_01340 [Gaiellaceae bacterium]|nr:hypothetical protein [Gaiellaceae bacterium]
MARLATIGIVTSDLADSVRFYRLLGLDVPDPGDSPHHVDVSSPAGRERELHAEQTSQRQEREAVRRPEEEGHVEGARGEDRQLAGRLEPRREEVRLGQ